MAAAVVRPPCARTTPVAKVAVIITPAAPKVPKRARGLAIGRAAAPTTGADQRVKPDRAVSLCAALRLDAARQSGDGRNTGVIEDADRYYPHPVGSAAHGHGQGRHLGRPRDRRRRNFGRPLGRRRAITTVLRSAPRRTAIAAYAAATASSPVAVRPRTLRIGGPCI